MHFCIVTHAMKRSAKRNLALWLGFLAIAGRRGDAVAQGAWRLDDQPYRAVFYVPPEAGMHVLVRVQSGDGDEPASAFSVMDAEGKTLPFRVVGSEARAVVMLVGVGPDPGKEYSIYFGAAKSAPPPDPSLADPVPVCVAIYPSHAKGIPNTWEKMMHMVGVAGAPSGVFRQHAFGPVLQPDGRSSQRESPIVRLSTFVFCPAAGPYRWALDCPDTGYLFVDGELAASRLGERPRTGLESGPAMFLEQGVHSVEVFQKSSAPPAIRIGWQTPATSAVEPLPQTAVLGSAMAETVRVECKADSIHPGFEYALGRAYVFRGRPEVFVPVKFRDTSVVSGGQSVKARWEFGDGARQDEGKQAEYVFKRQAAFKAALVLTDATGREYRCERTVDCRMLLPLPVAVTAQLSGLPAVCFAEDRIEPVIAVASVGAPWLQLDIAWTVLRADGESLSSTQRVAAARQPLNFPIGLLTAGDVERVIWSVSHAGVPLESEAVSFLRPPFDATVEEVRGSALFGGAGDRSVLVPHHEAGRFRQPDLTLDQAYGRVLCLDDTLATSSPHGEAGSSVYYRTLARIVNGPDRPIVEYVALGAWYGAPSSHGPLLKLTETKAAMRAGGVDVVVLSVGMQDMVRETAVADFERHVAAMADIVSATHGVAAVLATPPPFGADPASVRPYAAAIHRVAQTRAMPVADLYSAFMNAGVGRRELFAENNDFEISARGHQLAARVIARAMLNGGDVAR
jgi:hypothetical protein